MEESSLSVCDVNYALRSIVSFEKSGQLCMANNAKPNCFETENACARLLDTQEQYIMSIDN